MYSFVVICQSLSNYHTKSYTYSIYHLPKFFINTRLLPIYKPQDKLFPDYLIYRTQIKRIFLIKPQ